MIPILGVHGGAATVERLKTLARRVDEETLDEAIARFLEFVAREPDAAELRDVLVLVGARELSLVGGA